MRSQHFVADELRYFLILGELPFSMAMSRERKLIILAEEQHGPDFGRDHFHEPIEHDLAQFRLRLGAPHGQGPAVQSSQSALDAGTPGARPSRDRPAAARHRT